MHILPVSSLIHLVSTKLIEEIIAPPNIFSSLVYIDLFGIKMCMIKNVQNLDLNCLVMQSQVTNCC